MTKKTKVLFILLQKVLKNRKQISQALLNPHENPHKLFVKSKVRIENNLSAYKRKESLHFLEVE